MTQALDFAKEMSQAVDSAEESMAIAARYEYTPFLLKKHHRNGLLFADGSILYIVLETNKLVVPQED